MAHIKCNSNARIHKGRSLQKPWDNDPAKRCVSGTEQRQHIKLATAIDVHKRSQEQERR